MDNGAAGGYLKSRRISEYKIAAVDRTRINLSFTRGKQADH